jgi:hypothetical protein
MSAWVLGYRPTPRVGLLWQVVHMVQTGFFCILKKLSKQSSRQEANGCIMQKATALEVYYGI